MLVTLAVASVVSCAHWTVLRYTRVTPFTIGVMLGIMFVDHDFINIRLTKLKSRLLMLFVPCFLQESGFFDSVLQRSSACVGTQTP
eukprot:m.238296 g.238296  ORF g.238296 m.238296 type:complete len:86 (+) comp19387_c0_seq5:1665-1922(+)